MSENKAINCPVCESERISFLYDVTDHSLSKEVFTLKKCEHCDFVFTSNPPQETKIANYYKFEAYISHSDTKKGIMNILYHFSRKFMLSRKRKLIERRQNKGKLLDIGAGTGYFLNEMKTHHWEVEGIENDSDARKFAKQKFSLSLHPKEKLFDYRKSSFDVISLWHVLEHVYDMDNYLSTIHKLLKENGLLMIALPNAKSYDARIYKSFWAAWDVPRHIWHFSEKNVRLLLKKHQFDLKDIKGMPLDGAYISLLSEKYKGGGLLKALFYAKMAFFIGLMSKKKASSLLYIIRKK